MHIHLRWTTTIYYCYYCITSSIKYVNYDFIWFCINSLQDHMMINLIIWKNTSPPSLQVMIQSHGLVDLDFDY